MGTYKAKCDICHAENEVPNYGDWACSQCGQRYEYDEGHRIRLTDAQLESLRNPPRWIPVSERLPEHGEIVAVVTRFGVVLAADRDGGKWFHTAPEMVTQEIHCVTHWMPLPKPPQVS